MALEHDTQVLAKQILEDLKPELIIPSPYSIWDPSRMKFEVAGVTNPQSLAEMQALLVKKAFTVSDMYILRVIRMLGHADLVNGMIRPEAVKPDGGSTDEELRVTTSIGVRPAFAVPQG